MSTIDVLGLKVESVLPEQTSSDVKVDTNISITFNSIVDVRTVASSILVLEDKNNLPLTSEIDIKKYKVISGDLSLRDKVITFTPKVKLEFGTRYIIYVTKGSISDIVGRELISNYISYFVTGFEESLPKCEIVYPVNNSTVKSDFEIEIKNNSYTYIVQISKLNSFETTILDMVLDSNKKTVTLEDGIYFIRAKIQNGEFGDVVQVSVNSNEDIIVGNEIEQNRYFEKEYMSKVSSFPEENALLVNTKTNIIIAEFDDKIDSFDPYESSVIGLLFDEEDSYDSTESNNYIKEHGEVDGSFIIINGETESYLVFSPVELSGVI